MKYRINSQRYSINDSLGASALVVGFAKKITIDEILSNFKDIRKIVPILNSCLRKKENIYYFDEDCAGYDYQIEDCSSVNPWLLKQYKLPLDLDNGEYLRIALSNDNTLIIYAHNIVSDSRGLVNFAKALLLGTKDFDFEYCEDIENKTNFLNMLSTNKYKKLKPTKALCNEIDKVKIKKVTLKSEIAFAICGSQGVSLLSFFVTVALSLSKVTRRSIVIPFCSKKQDNIILVNESSNIKFKRGLEPRLSFYENCTEIDKLFKSFLKRKPFLLRNEILNKISPSVIDKPFENEVYNKFLTSELFFDVLPTITEDEILTNLSYYPSSSFCSNSFGISVIDDKVTICSIIHNKEGEDLFAAYQQTINLLAKNADFLNKK